MVFSIRSKLLIVHSQTIFMMYGIKRMSCHKGIAGSKERGFRRKHPMGDIRFV